MVFFVYYWLNYVSGLHRLQMSHYLIVLDQLDCDLITLGALDFSGQETLFVIWNPAVLLAIEGLGLLPQELLAVNRKILKIGIGWIKHGDVSDQRSPLLL